MIKVGTNRATRQRLCNEFEVSNQDYTDGLTGYCYIEDEIGIVGLVMYLRCLKKYVIGFVDDIHSAYDSDQLQEIADFLKNLE